MKAIRTSFLASLAAALFSVTPASASNFLNGAVAGFDDNWSVSDGSDPETVATKSGSGDTLTLAFDLADDQTLTYTAPTASDANGTADVVISNAVFTTAFEHPGVEAVGGIDSQAAICVYTNTTSGGPLQYYGWAGAYTVENDVTNLTWNALTGATPVEGATNTVTMSFDYTASPATVTFKVGDTTLTPSGITLSTSKTQVTGVSFSGTGSIGEMAGASVAPAPSTVVATFLNGDGSTITNLDVAVGTTPVYPAGAPTPTKAQTAATNFTFSTWSPALADISAAQTYTPVFTEEVRSYTITWNDDAGNLIDTTSVAYGTVPSYAAQAKAATAEYTYTWAGWTPAPTAVAGDATYQATFTSTKNSYTITWKDGDGETLKTETLEYGDTPAYTGATPTKTGDGSVTYTFNDTWLPAIGSVSGDQTYVAQFDSSVNTFDVTFYTNDVASAFWVTNVAYGTVPEYLAPAPTKAADAQYTWYFAGFTNTVATVPTNLFDAVSANVSYYPVFTNTVNKYTVVFEDEDGTEISSAQYDYGTAAADIVKPADPTKAGDAQYTWTFSGWSPTVANVTGDATYTATYGSTLNTYTVTWVVNGVTVETDENVAYGTTPTYDGATPTKAATAQYTYGFTGWSPAVGAIEGNTQYVAQFSETLNTYTVTWQNYDGTTLETDQNVAYGTTPTYDGETPTKPATTEKTFSFTGWLPAVGAISGDTEYVAQFSESPRKYTVLFVTENNETVSSAQYDYGTLAADIAVPAAPAKTSTAQYDYTFAGWGTIADVTGDATYTASYTPVLRSYTITWKNGDATLDTDTVAYGVMPEYEGETPTKDADAQYTYTFSGWSPEVASVSGEATYTAQFTPVARPTLALLKPTLSSTALANAQSGAVVRATISPAATVTGSSATTGVSVDVDGATATFTSLPWNEAVDWTLSAEGASAALPGRFYAKGETSWFNVATKEFDDVTDLAEGMKGVDMSSDPSASNQMVRIQTCLEIPDGAMDALPDSTGVGEARTGFAVAQLTGDEAPAFYAYTGDGEQGVNGWVKLLGATPVANTTNDLLIVLDVEDATARYYVDGIALYSGSAQAPAYAIPMKAFAANETKQINGIGFANADGVLSPVVAEYDVPFEAAVGDVPYLAAADGLEHADKTGVRTLYLLTNDVAGTIELDVGDIVKVDTTKGSFAQGSGVGLVSGIAAGYTLVVAADGNLTTYTVDLVEYPIEYVLGLAGATNAVANPTSYNVSSNFPIALLPAGCPDYTFNGWTNAAGAVVTEIAAGTTGAVTNWATWRRNAFTITWNNYDGALLGTTEVLPGDPVVWSGADPEKAADNTYTYTFVGWSDTQGGNAITVPEASANATYFAVFTPVYRDYTVTWTDHDGTVKTESLHYGDTPTAPSTAPAQYVEDGKIYTGTWPTPADVTGNATYAAVYDEGVTAVATVFTVADNGATTNTVGTYSTLADAFGAATNGCTLALLASATADTAVTVTNGVTVEAGAFTATFSGGVTVPMSATATFVVGEGGSFVFDSTATLVKSYYAEDPATTLVLPTSGYSLTANGSIVTDSPENTYVKKVVADGTDTYSVLRKRSVVTVAATGATVTGVGEGQRVAPGETLEIGAEGVAAGYEAVLTITKHADASVLATTKDLPFSYEMPDFDVDVSVEAVLKTFTVIWVVEDQVPVTNTVAWGTATADVKPADPTKASTGSAVYAFAGWSPALAETVTQDATYTAQFSSIYLDPASLAINYNCYGTVAVSNAPAGATFFWTMYTNDVAFSSLSGPLPISSGKTTSTLKFYAATTPVADGWAVVSITNGAEVITLRAPVVVKDVAAVVDGVEYAKADLDAAGAAALAGGKTLGLYVNGPTITLAEGQTLVSQVLSERNTPTPSVKAPAGTAEKVYTVNTAIDNATKTRTYTLTYDTPTVMYTSTDGETVEYLDANFKMSKDGTYKLLKDVERGQLSVGNNVDAVLDLDGHEFASTLSGSKGAIYVDSLIGSPSLTIRDTAGGGSIVAENCYAIWGNRNATIAIEGGEIVGKADVVYLSNAADTLTITGGTFRMASGSANFMLNMLDSARGTITVTGGSFQGFDPANNVAEGAGTSFLPATGYVSVADDPSSGWFTVYEAVTVTFADDKVTPPEAQVIGKGKTATEPTAPAFTGWTFEGWYTNLVAGEAWDFDDPVVEDITLTAKWTQNEYDVIWVADGAQFASNRVAHGTAMPVPATNPTRDGDDDALYTFVKWTPAQDATVTSNATYTAEFKTWTKIAVPTAAANLVYTGSEQTGVAAGTGYTLSGVAVGTNAGDYTATASLADAQNTVWADATEVNAAATAAKTIGWSIAKASVTVKANDAGKTYNESDPAVFTATVTGLIGSDTVAYTVSREAGEEVGTYTITPTGETEQGNYTVTYQTGTFTIDPIGTFTIIWLAGDGSKIAEEAVEANTSPSRTPPEKSDPTDKYTYEFAGWKDTATGTVYPGVLPVATMAATYQATYTTLVATKLALPLADHAVDATVNGASATVALAPTGTIAGVTYTAAPAAAWSDATTSFSFEGLDWNAGTNWTVDAAQGADALAETAHNEGVFYAKASVELFSASPNDFEEFDDFGIAGVGYSNEVASAEGEAVRVHTTIDVPDGGLESEPEVGGAKAGFAVLQLTGDAKPAFYAYNAGSNGAGTWTKLFGVEPKAGEADYLAVYDFAATTPAVRYYIDGVPLYAEGEGGAKVYAIPLAGMTSLSTVAFGDAAMVKDDVVAVQDVSYVAAVGETPYTNIVEALAAVTAADKAEANEVTLSLLKANLDPGATTVALAAGEAVTVDATSGSFAGDAPFVAADAPTYKVVTTGTAPVLTYKVELNLATVIWLAEDGATEVWRTNAVIGTVPVYEGPDQAKNATDAALYTFSGWTNAAGVAYAPTDAFPAVAIGGTNYVATFKTWTKVARPTVATGLEYTGEEQIGVTVPAGSTATGAVKGTNAGDYTATVSLDSADSVWADATDPAAATARETITANWSIAPKTIALTWGKTSFVWDGTAKLPTVETSDFVAGDDVTVAASGERTAVGTGYTATAALSGADAANYALPADPTTTFEIIAANAMTISVADTDTGATTTNYFATVQAAVDAAADAVPAVESVVLLADATETVVVSNAVALVLDGKTLTGDVTNTVAATISGGTVTGALVADGAALSIAGGTYQGVLSTNDAGSISITGGHFANDPTAFVADGYYAAAGDPDGYDVLAQNSILETTITVATDLEYDGTGKAGVTGVSFGGTDLVPDTDYTVEYTANTNAGVNTASAKITGIGAWKDYTNVTFSIAQRSATFTAESASKVYDGQPLSTNDFAVAGLVAGHTATATVAGSQTDVGVSSNVVSAVSIVDGDSNDVTANYAINYVDGELEVTKAAITITIAGVDSTAVYTGSEQTTNVAWTATSETVGFVATKVSYTGDVSVAGTTVADYAYNLDATKFVYADDNFTATFTVDPDGKFTITPAAITITVAGYNGVYDGAAHPAEVETVPADATILWSVDGGEWTADTPSIKDVGSKEVRAKASKANYADATSEVVSLAVTKAPLAVAAKAFEITYGDAPANGGVTYAGFVGEEDESVLGGTLAYAYTYEQFGDVGTAYTITPSGLTSDNYDISYTAGTLTVVAKEVGLTWSPDPATFTYDGTAKVPTATATGLVNNDVISVTVTGEQTNAGTGYTATATGLTGAKAGNYKLPAAATTTFDIEPAAMTIEVAGYTGVYDGAAHVASATTEPAGATVTWSVDGGAFTDTVPSVTGVTNVTIVAKATLENYADATATTSLVVTAKAITITADNKTKVYDNNATTDPELTATVTNAVAGDTINYTVSREAGQAVADYAITVTAGENPNYAVTVKPGTFSITAATVEIPAAPENKVYNGQNQTADVTAPETVTVTNAGGKDVGDYTLTFALADPANYTWSDGSVTNQVFGWSITPASVTVKADNASKKHGEAEPDAFTATVTGLLGSDTEAVLTYTVTRAEGEAIGTYTITPAGEAAQGNYTVTYETGTFTIEENKITIIWVVDGNETTNKVEWGDLPAFAGSTEKTDSTGKYAYEFTGWSPEVTNATVQAIYTAGYATTIGTPLALALDDPKLSSTAVSAAAKTATVAADLIGAVEGVQVAAEGATVAVSGDTATASFSGLAWNQGVEWTMTASQTAEDDAKTAESAELPGKFYVKPETAWFTAAAADLVAVSDASDAEFGITTNASPEGEMVRVHTQLEVPAVGLSAPPNVGSAKAGFAVLQLDGDTASAYYAYGNGTWTKLAGVAPAAGTVDYLAVYDLAAEAPTARYYVNGVALYAEGDGGAKVYAIPLAATTKSLSSISFASADMVKADIVAEHDVSYVAAVGETPYTDIVGAVEAQGLDAAKTLALLKTGVGLAAPVSLDAVGQAFVVDYANGSFTNDTVAASALPGYDVKVTEAETVKTYALDPIVYPIEYVLGGGVNDASNTNEYTVADLPLALADASRTGYTFAGWTNNVSANAVATSIPVGTTGAVTNVATWTINNYLLTVNYLYTNGTVAATQFTSNVVYDTAYSVDSPVVQGYTADQLVVSGTMGAEPVTVDVTYRVNRYPVTFVDEDGTTLKAATEYDYGTLAADIAKPEDPTKAATADWVFTFAGWSPALADVTAEATYTATYTSNATVAAVITIADNGDGTATTNTAYVASLADAIAAANDGDTVQLLADVSEPAVALEDDITLDLNGNTWTVAGTGEPPVTNAVTIAGNVEIVDNSENGNGAISSAADQVLVVDAADEEGATASVTIGENAAIVATGDDAAALAVVDGEATVEGDVTGGVAVAADGALTVDGGTVTGDVTATGGDVTVADGTVDGDVTATGDGAIVAVTGGAVTGGVAVSGGADATVSAGSVADGIAATGEGSTVAVSGGTVSGGVTATGAGSEATVTGGEIAGGVTIADGATGTVSGDDTVVNGTLTGTEETLVIDGGHFDNDPSAYVKEGYVAVADTPSGYKVQPGKSVIGTTITVAGGTYNGQAYEIGSVVLGNYTLTASDYTVVYTNVIDGVATNDNVNAGTVTATITGIGEWIDTTNVTFTIAKAALTITADDITVPFRTPAADVEYTLSYSGFVNGETNTVFTTQATATSTYDDATAEAGDTFPITVSGAVAANYEITFVGGTLTVGDAEAPTILGTTSITVAQSTVTLQHVLQTGAKYYTYFTCTDLAKGEWVAAENSRAAESITSETVTDADGVDHEGTTVVFTGVTDDVRFYQVGYSSVPYAFGDAMGLKATEGGEQP